MGSNLDYLGFSWQHSREISPEKFSKVTVPDPTTYLKRNLEILFDSESRQELSIKKFMDKLSNYAPVFEFGSFRDEIEQQMLGNIRFPNTLSTVTSMSLFRLEEEKLIKLTKESDADVLILADGNEERRISHITLMEKK